MTCVGCGSGNDPASRYCGTCARPLSGPAGDNGKGSPLPVSRSLLRPIAVAAVALLAVVAAGGVAWAMTREEVAAPVTSVSTDAGRPVTTGPAAAQAPALDRLLDLSRRSRDKLTLGLKAAADCATLSSSLIDLRAVGVERTQERDILAGLDLSAIGDGDALRDALTDAFTHSIAADVSYVKWAEERTSNGCRDSATAIGHYAAGGQESVQAGQSKQMFVDLWNPVAAGAGLPARDRLGL